MPRGKKNTKGDTEKKEKVKKEPKTKKVMTTEELKTFMGKRSKCVQTYRNKYYKIKNKTVKAPKVPKVPKVPKTKKTVKNREPSNTSPKISPI
jgi:hypothetical protein